jgi:hypothetical protein
VQGKECNGNEVARLSHGLHNSPNGDNVPATGACTDDSAATRRVQFNELVQVMPAVSVEPGWQESPSRTFRSPAKLVSPHAGKLAAYRQKLKLMHDTARE